jgi:hypothetical protein
MRHGDTMTLDELIQNYRKVFADQAEGYDFCDTDITAWFNEAVVEACRRALLIVDSNASFCTIPTSSGNYQFALDPRIIFIQRVKVASQDIPLWETTLGQLDIYYPGWEGKQSSTPTVFFTDQKPLTLSVYPKFSKTDSIKLTVAREPVTPMVALTESPEIPARFHRQLLDWVLYRAINVRDTDIAYGIRQETKWTAQDHLAAFTQSFGERPESADECRALLGYPRTSAFGQNAAMGGKVTSAPNAPNGA